MDEIFGDADDLLELYERGKAARSGGRLGGPPPEDAPEPLEGEDEDEAELRQEAFAQRQARPDPECF